MRVTARYAQRYFAPDAYVGNRDELARRRNNGTEGETGGGGEGTFEPPFEKGEKVYIRTKVCN